MTALPHPMPNHSPGPSSGDDKRRGTEPTAASRKTKDTSPIGWVESRPVHCTLLPLPERWCLHCPRGRTSKKPGKLSQDWNRQSTQSLISSRVQANFRPSVVNSGHPQNIGRTEKGRCLSCNSGKNQVLQHIMICLFRVFRFFCSHNQSFSRLLALLRQCNGFSDTQDIFSPDKLLHR